LVSNWTFWLGTVLILIGVVAGFFWFKGKNKYSIPVKEISIKTKKKVRKK